MSAQVIPTPPRVWFEVEHSDRWRAVTWLAIAAAAIALVMAIVGLPPVDLHMPPHYAGIMDPLCGGTRAIRLAALGHWSESWRYNPIGIPLLIICVILVVRAAIGWLFGRWLTLRIHWTRRGKQIAWLLVAVAVIALEINQQAHVELLMSHAGS